MSDDDVQRLDAAILGINKMSSALNTFAEASLKMADQHHALVTIVMQFAKHAEANNGVSRSTICSDTLKYLTTQCGASVEREVFVRGILGQGDPPKPPPTLSIIPGGRTD